jgi:hypothetical protein
MKILNYKKLALLVLVFAFSCVDMNVVNLNEPDQERVLSDPNDIIGLVGNSFSTWYDATHWYEGVGMMLNTASDNTTCSWGNQGMRDMSWEPRKAWDNTPSYGYGSCTEWLFNKSYSAIAAANSALDAIDRELDFGDDKDKVIAFSKFIQGISHGYLALVFDQAYIVTEQTPQEELLNPVLMSYTEVAAAAIALLEEAIAASDNTFTIEAAWMGTSSSMSNVEFKQLVNSYAARIMAYMPRNKTDNGNVDWAKVGAFANAGITSDFIVQGDGYSKWVNDGNMVYSVRPGWGAADMRLINMLDADQPSRWANSATFYPPETAAAKAGVDERLYTDFTYMPSNWFRVERGYYHFTNYRISRYDYFIGDWLGDMPELKLSENDMLRAEAELQNGNPANAANIINAGTRTTRGLLANVSTTDVAAIDMAIHRERQIELLATGLGISFFDMRKRDMLQPGTPLHMPIPASVLEVLQMPFYTFGGSDGDPGNDTSIGGWF